MVQEVTGTLSTAVHGVTGTRYPALRCSLPGMRAAEHGITIGQRPPGHGNAITDVPGVLVGHANHRPDHTGVTAIVPRAGSDAWLEPYFAGAACLNGAGEIAGLAQIEEWGFAETPIFLTGTPYVGAVYDAATIALSEAQPRIGRDDVIIPVVAECDPSGVCDVRTGPRPDVALVKQALAAASDDVPLEGQIGAGVGMQCFDWAGGIGTASRQAGAYTVGVLLLVNFGDGPELRIAGRQVGHLITPAPARGREGSCACIVATDAPLLPSQLTRLARRPFLGLARTGSYGSNGSGEVAVAFSTANVSALRRDEPATSVAVEMLRNDHLNDLFAAATDAAEEAVLNALFAGRGLEGAVRSLLPFPSDRV